MSKANCRAVSVLMIVAVVYSCAVFLGRGFAAISAAQLSDKPPCIIIDAGHGGEDGGSSTADGVRESHINLAISLRTRDLMHLCGMHTKMIRETDLSVYSEGCQTLREKKQSDLKNRVKLINETQNAVLLSIHQNYFPVSKYKGAQAFFAPTDGSRDLASQTQALIQTIQPDNHRTCADAPSVYLMQNVTCPAVLVECSFLSNAQDAKLIQTDIHQQKLCAVFCSAISTFIQQKGTVNEV